MAEVDEGWEGMKGGGRSQWFHGSNKVLGNDCAQQRLIVLVGGTPLSVRLLK